LSWVMVARRYREKKLLVNRKPVPRERGALHEFDGGNH
jgi:hypothetical protein